MRPEEVVGSRLWGGWRVLGLVVDSSSGVCWTLGRLESEGIERLREGEGVSESGGLRLLIGGALGGDYPGDGVIT